MQSLERTLECTYLNVGKYIFLVMWHMKRSKLATVTQGIDPVSLQNGPLK